MQLNEEVKSLLSRLGETPETFTGRILFMSMFNDISCDKKDNEEECLANAKVVSIYAKKFGTGQWSFIGPASEKKWYSMEENSPQGIWDHIAEKMLVEFAESGCPIFSATAPFSVPQIMKEIVEVFRVRGAAVYGGVFASRRLDGVWGIFRQ